MTWSIPTISCYVLWIWCMETLSSVRTVKNFWIQILKVHWKKLSTFIQSLQGLLRLLKLGWIYVEENKFNNIDFKYVGINIFYVRLRSQVSINVVCHNRLLNFVSNMVSQECNLLWKYHWRNFQVKISVKDILMSVDKHLMAQLSLDTSDRRVPERHQFGKIRCSDPRAATGWFLSPFWIVAVLSLKRMDTCNGLDNHKYKWLGKVSIAFLAPCFPGSHFIFSAVQYSHLLHSDSDGNWDNCLKFTSINFIVHEHLIGFLLELFFKYLSLNIYFFKSLLKIEFW